MTLRFAPPAHRSPALPCPSDRALLDAVAAGCRAGLKELFSRHGAAVHHLVTVLSADLDAADCVVEDVFVALWRGHGRLEDEVANVRLGLLAMARRRCLPAADAAAISGPQCLGAEEREAVLLTVLATAMLTDVALVLQEDRHVVGSRMRAGLRARRT